MSGPGLVVIAARIFTDDETRINVPRAIGYKSALSFHEGGHLIELDCALLRGFS